MSSTNPSLPQYVETCVEFITEEGEITHTDFLVGNGVFKELFPLYGHLWFIQPMPTF